MESVCAHRVCSYVFVPLLLHPFISLFKNAQLLRYVAFLILETLKIGEILDNAQIPEGLF